MMRPHSILVASVPHSGTRTLVEHLGAPGHTHFHQNLSIRPKDGAKELSVVHIPVRHPMAVARSWAERNKPFSGLLSAYRKMFEYMEAHEGRYELHRVEDLSGRLGADDVRGKRPYSVEKFQAELMERVVEPNRAFFERFYEDI